MRTITADTPFARACKRANELCRRYRVTFYVTHDSLDEPDEYHILSARDMGDGPLDNGPIRYSAEWTPSGVHGTRS